MDLKNFEIKSNLQLVKDKIVKAPYEKFLEECGINDIYMMGYVAAFESFLSRKYNFTKNDLAEILKGWIKEDNISKEIKDVIIEVLKEYGYWTDENSVRHLTGCPNSGYYCPHCSKRVSEIKMKNYKYCFNCGKELNWKEIKEI